MLLLLFVWNFKLAKIIMTIIKNMGGFIHILKEILMFVNNNVKVSGLIIKLWSNRLIKIKKRANKKLNKNVKMFPNW
jgi:hypothetical protein